jgi:hypothetical protein
VNPGYNQPGLVGEHAELGPVPGSQLDIAGLTCVFAVAGLTNKFAAIPSMLGPLATSAPYLTLTRWP